MALIAISGQPGSRHEEAARIAAQLLEFDLISPGRLRELLDEAFGGEGAIPDKAFAPAAMSIVARLATGHHLVISTNGAELLFKDFPATLRVYVVAPDARRIGTLMLENGLDRPGARQLLRNLDSQQRAGRKRKFGKADARAQDFDLVLNSEQLEPEQIADLIAGAAALRGLREQGPLSPEAEAHLQFQVRLKLLRHGIEAPGKANLKKAAFAHPSEETFANLLDFYRVAWEYEPKSFPVRWDKDGRVIESFTPDFHLPEFDLYVELTTMKQSLVTKKNRKVKLLRANYPHVNIQVFYQKDLENLVFKYGLAERVVKA
ncbi:MAG: cytidylate kinase family protein [Bryobacteraceae bacterium]